MAALPQPGDELPVLLRPGKLISRCPRGRGRFRSSARRKLGSSLRNLGIRAGQFGHCARSPAGAGQTYGDGMSLVRTWARRSAGSGSGQLSIAGPVPARGPLGPRAADCPGPDLAAGRGPSVPAVYVHTRIRPRRHRSRGRRQPGGRARPRVLVGWPGRFASCRVEHAVRDGSAAARRWPAVAARGPGRARRFGRLGPGVSWIGEGAGGLLAGGTLSYTEAPGAALLYVLLAVLIWPGRRYRAQDVAPGASVATTGPLGAVVPRVAWTLLWAGLGYLILQPASRAAGSVSAMLTDMKDGEPGWIASLDGGLARVLAGHGTVVAIILAMLCTAAVLGIAAPPRVTRIGLSLRRWPAWPSGSSRTSARSSPARAPIPIRGYCSSPSPPRSGPSSRAPPPPDLSQLSRISRRAMVMRKGLDDDAKRAIAETRR